MGKSGRLWAQSMVVVASGSFAATAASHSGPPLAAAESSTHMVAPASPNEQRSFGQPALRAIELELRAWMDDAASVTVRVGSDHSRGSGTVISRRHVLTAAHVVDSSASVVVTLRSGREVQGRVLARDVNRDIALLSIPVNAEHCAPLATRKPEAGTWVVSAGFVAGVEHALPATTSIGVVLDSEKHIALRQGLSQGMSGGPVLSTDGEVVGVNTRTDGGALVLRSDELVADAHCEDAPHARVVPRAPFNLARWADARDAAFRTLQTNRSDVHPHASSVVTLSNFHVQTRGVAVGRDVILAPVDDALARSHDCTSLILVGQEDARCTEIVAEGELMRVRFPTAYLVPLAAEPAEVQRGSLVRTADGLAYGVVDALVSPGLLTPFLPRPSGRTCGTLQNLHRMENPTVVLDEVFAHDVHAARGELLVNGDGVPVGIVVGQHVFGRAYAVPFVSALARFRH